MIRESDWIGQEFGNKKVILKLMDHIWNIILPVTKCLPIKK